jgi:hypothetical protein
MASQNPTSFTFNQSDGTFTFSNEHVTIVGQTNFLNVPPEPLTVDSVTLENPGHSVDLGITSVEVPPPVIEHLSHEQHFDLLI